MPVLRPCAAREGKRGCPRYAEPGKSYCAEHQAEKERSRNRPASSTVTWSAKWKRVRAAVVRKRRRPDGTWLCEMCGKSIASMNDIDVDHATPLAEELAGAFDESNLRVAHRSCNRRAGALMQAEMRRERLSESRIGQEREARARAQRLPSSGTGAKRV